jgi:hypothetical protein
MLREISTIVSPDTLLAWHRHLIAQIRRPLPARAGTAAGGGPRFGSWLSAWQPRIATGGTRGFKERSPTWATTSGAGPSRPSCGNTALSPLPSGRSGRRGRSS